MSNMCTHRGAAVESWVRVDDGCALECTVIGEDSEFTFGHSGGLLSVVVSEEVLVRLVSVATEALTRLQAIPPGEEVDFTVIPP